MSNRKNRNEVLKKRYQVYRRLGYDSATSRALSFRSLDVSQLEISKKTGKLKRNTTTKQFIETDMQQWKNDRIVDRYNERVSELKNDTVYTRFGMLTHDKRYKGENGKIISVIRNQTRKVEKRDQNGNIVRYRNGRPIMTVERLKLTTDQAYYFWYMMLKYDLSMDHAQRNLLSNTEFEEYVKVRKSHRSPDYYKKRKEFENKVKRGNK